MSVAYKNSIIIISFVKNKTALSSAAMLGLNNVVMCGIECKVTIVCLWDWLSIFTSYCTVPPPHEAAIISISIQLARAPALPRAGVQHASFIAMSLLPLQPSWLLWQGGDASLSLDKAEVLVPDH